MEKLLHERLRSSGRLDEEYVLLSDGTKRAFIDHIGMFSLADEIERYYISRPRFEDGTPLKNGDEIDYNGRAEKVVSYIVCGETREDVDYGAREPYATLHLKCGACYNVPLGEPLKRPTPKVYDADGVPCKPNDEVWSTSKEGIYEEGDMMIVVGIDAGVKERQVLVRRALGGAGEQWVNSKYLTHERPVFDADGERICKGDTVWHVGDESRGTVVGVIMDNTWHGYPVKVAWDEGDEGFYQGGALTHREPDSLEKLLERMEDYAQKNEGYVDGSKVGYFSKELRALIERGA